MEEEKKGKYPESRKRGLMKPWQPGQSGNPLGRPKKKPISQRYEQLAETLIDEAVRIKMKLPKGMTYGDAAALMQFLQALKGKTEAIKEIREAIEGRAPQVLIGDEDAPPVQINVSAIPKKRELV